MYPKVFVKSSFPKALLFLSGTGTNAEKLLSSENYGRTWCCSAVVTDRPDSAAKTIAQTWNLPLIEVDIFRFYAKHGLSRISMSTPEGFAVRNLWTQALREAVAPYRSDFGILAGFIPLTNLVADFPCLNIHPGDLTVERDGKRLLVGLHDLPIRTALLSGFHSLRSTVLIATPFTPGAREMDAGLLPGISAPVPVRLPDGVRLEDLSRSETLLAEVAKENLEHLKVNGDWILFPRVVSDFAAGRFAVAENGSLSYREGETWVKIQTVEYGLKKNRLIKG